MAKFKNKYRIESNRLDGWDYGRNALYFVTLCTQNRICYFGQVKEQKMYLSDIGKKAEQCWLDIPLHFPFVVLHGHIVMPNHVHGVIEIAKNNDNNPNDNADNNVEMQNLASLPPSSVLPQPYKNQFGPQSKNLASIIRGYKIGVTKYAKKIISDWGWQPNYHDHIIRNPKSYQNIIHYMDNNPVNWKADRFYSD